MTLRHPLLAAALVLPAISFAAEIAASSAASSASQSVSTSIGSLSGSVQGSSRASSGQDVAQGDYRIEQVAELAGQPGMLQLTLQAVDQPGADGELRLTLPAVVAREARLAPGLVVTASHRPFGLEFARRADRQAFFLLLADDWLRDLPARPVTL